MSTVSIQPFNHPLFERYDVSVALLRLDQIDPLISGNKWFKLQPLIEQHDRHIPILSYGGAHSNHLHALARFGQLHGIPTIGIVRGDPQQTDTLTDARNWGMQIRFIPRDTYRDTQDPALARALHQQYGAFVQIPPGGSTLESARACRHIWEHIPADYPVDHLLVSAGTGTTLAGLIAGAPSGVKITGVAALKESQHLGEDVRGFLCALGRDESVNWQLVPALPLRFAKLNAELAGLWRRASGWGVELDPVYTLRTLHYLVRYLLDGRAQRGERIVLIHTGGLQGLRGQQARLDRLSSALCGPLPL